MLILSEGRRTVINLGMLSLIISISRDIFLNPHLIAFIYHGQVSSNIGSSSSSEFSNLITFFLLFHLHMHYYPHLSPLYQGWASDRIWINPIRSEPIRTCSDRIQIDLQLRSDKNFVIRSDLIRIGSDLDQSEQSNRIALCN